MPFRKAKPWGGVKPPVGSTLNDDPINYGLSVFAPMNEGAGPTVRDIAGRNTGILTNGPTWSVAKFGNGVLLDGSDDFIDFGAPTALASYNYATASIWVKFNSLANAYTAIVSDYNGGPTAAFQLFIKSNGKIAFYVSDVNYDGTGALTLTTGVWYHIAAVWNAGTASVYVNGALDGSTGVGNSPIVSSGNLYIGNDQVTAGRNLAGVVDNFRWYSRVLSASESQRLDADPFAGIAFPRRRIISQVAAGAAPAFIARQSYQVRQALNRASTF